MKTTVLTTIIILSAILLSACGPLNAASNQAVGLLSTTVEQLGQKTSAGEAETGLTTQPTQVVPDSDVAGLLAAYQGALQSIYSTVNPSVVNIRVVQKGVSAEMGLPFNLPELPQIPGMPEIPQTPDQEEVPYSQGLGSGFVWDKAGHIITNNHVIEGADKIEITFYDGTVAPGELVGADPDSDLAVVKVDVADELLKPVQIADSKNVQVGQLAIAIGNPYGLEGTMTVGIISALGRTMPASLGLQNSPGYSIPDIIQTDAPINPGNSGGVLVNDMGEVIGVTFAIESSSGANAGIGFVIPSSIVKRVIPSLIDQGSYAHPYLGISGVSLNPDLAKAMGLETSQRGALIAEVVPDGPADNAGLKGSDQQVEIDGQQVSVGGDVIVAVNGEKIEEMDDLIAYLSNSAKVGDTIVVTILRDGKEKEVEVTLEARPGQTTEKSIDTQPQAKAWLGILGTTLTPELAEAMDVSSDQSGVLVEQVQSNSPADKAGLRGSNTLVTIDGQQVMVGGDIIIALDGKSVDSMDDLLGLLKSAEPGQKITLTILREDKTQDLEVVLGERSE